MSKDSNSKIMWTIQECADYSGMSPGAIRRKIKEKKLAFVPVGVKQLVNRDVFLQFLLGTTGPAPEPAEDGVIRHVN